MQGRMQTRRPVPSTVHKVGAARALAKGVAKGATKEVNEMKLTLVAAAREAGGNAK